MTTSTFYAGTEDGQVVWDDYNQILSANSSGFVWFTGKWWYDVGIDEFQGFVRFDTSPIGTDSITSATFSPYLEEDLTTYEGGQDFIVEARLHSWGPTLTTADWLSSKTGKPLVAHIDTNGIGSMGYKDFVDDDLAANINKSGYTELIVMHDWSVVNTGHEDVAWYSAEQGGTTVDPKLIIVHGSGGTIYTKTHSADSRLKKEWRTQNALTGADETKITRENSAAGGDPFSVVSP